MCQRFLLLHLCSDDQKEEEERKKACSERESVRLISILRRETQRLLCLGNKSHTIRHDLHVQSIKLVIRTGTKLPYFHISTRIDTLILDVRQRLIGCTCSRAENTCHFERFVTTNPP